MRRIGRLLEDCNPNGFGYDLLQYFQPLHRQFRGQEGEPRRVAARARQTCDQAAFQWVGRRSHDDRDALRCALRGADRSGAADYDDIDLRPQQIADQRGYRFDIITIMAKLVGDVAPFDITEVAHPAHEFLAEWIVVRGSRPDVPDTRRLARLLRARRERPCSRAAEQGDELTPPMPNWRTIVDLHRAPLEGTALPDSCHKLRNAGQVFATNRETRKRCGEIRLKQVCGRC